MSIPLLVAFMGIALPIVWTAFILILIAKYRRKHTKEWGWRKFANQFTPLAIIACVIAEILVVYALSILGVGT